MSRLFSQLSREDAPRIAFACLIGAVMAAILTTSKVNVSGSASIMSWLTLCVVVGITQNTKEGRPLAVLFAGAAAATLSLISVLLFRFATGNSPIQISARMFPENFFSWNSEMFWIWLLMILPLAFATPIAIMIAAVARPEILNMVSAVFDLTEEHAQRISRAIELVIWGFTAAFTFWALFV